MAVVVAVVVAVPVPVVERLGTGVALVLVSWNCFHGIIIGSVGVVGRVGYTRRGYNEGKG